MTDEDDAEFIRSIAREAEDRDAQVQVAIRQAEQLAERYRPAIPGLRNAQQSAARMDEGLDAGLAELVAQTVRVAQVMNVMPAMSARDLTSEQAGFSVVQAAEIISRIEPEQAIALARQIAADPENAGALGKVSSRMQEAGVTGQSPGLLLIIVLVFLIAAGLPVALPELPASAQTVAMAEMGSVSLALAVVGLLADQENNG